MKISGINMTTKIFNLKNNAKPADVENAQRLVTELESLGFRGEHLEDHVFRVAQAFALKYKEDVGESSAQRSAALEFTAAEEINQHSMLDQLIVIQQWISDEEKFAGLLEQSFGLKFSTV